MRGPPVDVALLMRLVAAYPSPNWTGMRQRVVAARRLRMTCDREVCFMTEDYPGCLVFLKVQAIVPVWRDHGRPRWH